VGPVIPLETAAFRLTTPPHPDQSGIEGLLRRLPGRMMLDPSLPPQVAEQYRHLAARLHHASVRASTRIVMIASAMPAEGKTLTAANLALTLSESYRRRVIVIDADLRRPSMHLLFDLPNASGLNVALSGQGVPPAFEISARLSVIPAGPANPDPLGGLTSPAFEALVKSAARDHDWVIIDTPPVGLLADANLMVGLVDAVVMVIAANKASYKALQRAADALGRERIIGVVLNRASHDALAAGGGYGYGYGYGYGGRHSYGPRE
jgi:capsular exopolysaccharide synthesis family protein